jgi:putative flippase GtrA
MSTTSILSRFHMTYKELIKKRFVRFALVGIGNTAADFFLLNLIKSLTHTPASNEGKVALINGVSATLIASVSFFLNRKYVFKHDAAGHSKMFLFVGITLVGIYLIQSPMLYVALHTFDPVVGFFHGIVTYLSLDNVFSRDFITTNLAKAFGSIGSILWNYTLYKRFVFPPEHKK